jgi:RNA polymerase sigma factor (sigma-70 family)
MNAVSPMTSNVASISPHLILAGDVRAAARGDVRAFERLVDATKRAVTSIALAIVRDVRASEDVAQEVYVQAWRDLRTLKNADSFLPWIRQLTRNKSLTQMRGRRRYDRRHAPWEADSVDVAAHEAGTLDRAIAEEEELVLAEAIEALPDDAREVLTLFYREEQSVRHVAELLGLSEDAVKKRLERARTTLKDEVRQRFADVARRTAPTAALTASIITLITLGVPSTAAAATAAGTTLLKGTAGVAGAAVLGPVIGLVSGVGGVFLGMRGRIASAIDAKERAELTRYRNVWMLATLAFTTAIGGLGWIGEQGLLPRGVFALLTLSVSLSFMIFGGYSSQKVLPRILARRRELERERDPEGYALREKRDRRRHRLALAFGMTCAAAGTLTGLYFALTH